MSEAGTIAAPARPSVSALPYVPALDGLRGLAVAAVLVFHGGFDWAVGGFLGVSTFFTLSGFLITRLILEESNRTGNVSLRRFYVRRIRRLWPASLMTIVLIILYARFVAGPSEVADLRGELLAAIGQVANWQFILSGVSYGDLFRTPSLVQHFWSLAIEEQFYLVLPPLLAWAVRRRWSPSRLATAVVAALGLAAASTVVLLALDVSTDRLYYGSDTRSVELLTGVLLAVLFTGRRGFSPRTTAIVGGGGATALALTFVAWTVVEQSDGWLYRGGLWAYAAGSALIVAASLQPGAVSTLLSLEPLRRLGEISYGVYLLHWPIFRWLTPERLGTSRLPAFALGTTVAVAAAILSFALVEQPIRRGSWGRTWTRVNRPGAAPASAVVALLAVALAVPIVVPPAEEALDIEATAARFDDLADNVEPLPGAPRVGFFGDSTALSTAFGLATWSKTTGRIAFEKGRTELGCGVVTEGDVIYGEAVAHMDERCEPRRYEDYSQAAGRIDLAYVQFGPWDVGDHRLPGESEFRAPGDEVYDRALREEALRLVDLLTAEGAVVMWVLPPLVELGTVDGRPPAEPRSTSDPDRMERFREISRDVAEARPGKVELIDLAGWMATLPGGELDPDLRPDGVHFTNEAALTVADAWLGPEIERIWSEVRSR